MESRQKYQGVRTNLFFTIIGFLNFNLQCHEFTNESLKTLFVHFKSKNGIFRGVPPHPLTLSLHGEGGLIPALIYLKKFWAPLFSYS